MDASKNTSYFYNTFSLQLVGNYENWDFAHPVKDWCLTTSKCKLGDLAKFLGMGLLKVCWGDPPTLWGPVYQRLYLGLEESESKSLAIPPLSQEEAPQLLRETRRILSIF